MGVVPASLAAAYFAAHLFTLAPSLEDIDSINFALGLRDFDPAQHQPHPPGYPIYIAAGRVVLGVVRAIQPGLDRAAAEALALSLLSAIAGAVALLFAWRVFELLARDGTTTRRVRFWAAVLLGACPLFWLTGLRPLSDMPGLAAALAAQALLLAGRLNAGSFLAGLALGVRSQTLWLTAPLIGFELYRLRGEGAWRERSVAVALAVAGALCWGIPLVIAAGGMGAYLEALGSQAGEDFAFVDMLWANPTPRRLAFGLIHTLVYPWGSYQLAGLVLLLAAAGAGVMVLRERRALGVLLLAFGPYVVFHLVFQETVTVRYALPIAVPVAFLAARAIAAAGRAGKFVAAPIAATCLISAGIGARAYASGPHPAFRAIADASRRAEVDRPALVTTHFELRRSLRAAGPAALPVVYAPHGREWMEMVRYWSGGGRGLVWFLANPRRADLDLIDPHSRRDVVRYRWAPGNRLELSGTRPAAADWYRFRPPGWFLGEGWSLTPETGGLTHATGTGLDRQAITGYVRAHAGAMHAVVGGRHLEPAAHAPVDLEMSLAGAVVDRWTVAADNPAFVRFLDLPSGVPAAEDGYATLTIAATRDSTAPGAPVTPPAVAIRQFDIQPVSRAVVGFGAGWHDEELEAATGLRWRWTSDRAVLRVRSATRAVRVRVRGESPLRYFDAPPEVTLAAGGRAFERLRPSADWVLDAEVPSDALAASNGDLTIATNHVFVPAEVTGSPDTRRLGLRVFSVEVASVR